MASKDSVKVVFVWERDTKNKSRYQEVEGALSDRSYSIIGVLYVDKVWAAGAKRLVVDITKEDKK